MRPADQLPPSALPAVLRWARRNNVLVQPTGNQIRFDLSQSLLHEFVPIDAFQRAEMNPLHSGWHMDQPQEVAAVRGPASVDSYSFFAKHSPAPES